MINKYKKELKYALIGATAFITYMFLPDLVVSILSNFGFDISSLSVSIRLIISLFIEIIILAIIIILFKDKLKRDLLDLKKNHKTYFSKYLKYWFLILAIMFISNGLIIAINGGDIANNEESIRKLFNISPIYIFLSGVLIAPLTEELVFRQAFRYIFKTNWLFILISGFVFGGLHVFSSAETLLDFLYLIPYCTPGFVFAYLLVKTDNIFVPMGMHFLHNGLLISLQFLVLIFG